MSTHDFNNNSDQVERLHVHRDTYQTRAQADAANELGERYKKPVTVIGSGVPEYPRQPSNSPWHSDPVPPEGPLGFDIEFVGELGGASSTSLPCAEESATPDRGGAASSPSRLSSEE